MGRKSKRIVFAGQSWPMWGHAQVCVPTCPISREEKKRAWKSDHFHFTCQVLEPEAHVLSQLAAVNRDLVALIFLSSHCTLTFQGDMFFRRSWSESRAGIPGFVTDVSPLFSYMKPTPT